jgi:putative FmdB family regulatory protein
MPFYEYRCGSCGHELEAMQKMSDAPLSDCPACAKPDLVKLVSVAGFRLKGSGWYETDFKGGSKKKEADAGATESAGHSCGTGSCPSCS